MTDSRRVKELAEARERVDNLLEGDLPSWMPKPFRPVWWGGRELCRALGNVVDDNHLWGEFEGAVGHLDENEDYRMLVYRIDEMLRREDETLARLGVDEAKRNRVIQDAQRAVRILREPVRITPDRVQNLRERVNGARNVACRESRFRIRRKHIVSGGMIVSGGAIAGGNVAIESHLPSGQTLASLELAGRIIEVGVGIFFGELVVTW